MKSRWDIPRRTLVLQMFFDAVAPIVVLENALKGSLLARLD
jgi:hypothetical protein